MLVVIAWPDDEKTRTNWREQPFVEIPGVEVGADRIDVERDHGRSVSAVDDRGNPALTRCPAQLARGQNQSRWRQDVTEEEEACLARHGPRRGVDDVD